MEGHPSAHLLHPPSYQCHGPVSQLNFPEYSRNSLCSVEVIFLYLLRRVLRTWELASPDSLEARVTDQWWFALIFPRALSSHRVPALVVHLWNMCNGKWRLLEINAFPFLEIRVIWASTSQFLTLSVIYWIKPKTHVIFVVVEYQAWCFPGKHPWIGAELLNFGPNAIIDHPCDSGLRRTESSFCFFCQPMAWAACSPGVFLACEVIDPFSRLPRAPDLTYWNYSVTHSGENWIWQNPVAEKLSLESSLVTF